MPRAQRGQALVLGLFVLFLGTISMFFLFSTGQVSADKQRVTNTADAAAYSAALWRARVLNYDAYSNRAMIANEVAIAQTLTLASEVQYLKNLAACFAREEGDGGVLCQALLPNITQFIPYFVAALNYAYIGLQYADTGLKYTIDAEITYRSSVVNRALSLSQLPMHASANFAVLDNLVDQVVRANDPNFRSTVLPETRLFERFTRRYSGDDRSRLANIVRRQLDPYSQNRHFTLTVIPDICVAGLIYRKRGATALSEDMDRWEAVDDFSEWRYRFSLKDGCTRDEYPMSWADRQGAGESDPAPNRTRENEEAFGNSRDSAYTVDNYAGIQSFQDLAYDNLTDDDPNVRNPRHRVGVVVSLPAANLRTANKLNVGVGRLRMAENVARDRIASVGAAEVYFKRPTPRADGRVELPSLFNPYWQARLVEPSLEQKALAATL
jgi:hypothetical protein